MPTIQHHKVRKPRMTKLEQDVEIRAHYPFPLCQKQICGLFPKPCMVEGKPADLAKALMVERSTADLAKASMVEPSTADLAKALMVEPSTADLAKAVEVARSLL